ncbi:BlaI/MecI/CopY family transcriptional regulator [Roseovarius pelagicus]|uniref:BlaI/MecI/CopY family transcriptional regulator n=1 Tax=Roseovarius pelagicus TaxID=2980108 RepID=A0ABY6DBL5_9RHOB|nr:BlaI/MecI/CopY family transcriptional regulator [Roseovarius pelagicus]UXX83531.1 BlaI/MecI/CopY family transcriptional regulator [Roseovarius pelagicus]
MRQRKKHDFLTDVELELMSHLWDLGRGSVRDVLGCLVPERKLAYTSAATILRIMEQKGFVRSDMQGKSLIYVPLLAKDTYQAKTLRDLSDKLFDGTPATLVARLVDDTGMSEQALEEIRALLDRRLRDDPAE